MNDKFAADLRRHLVRAADERPAHGQQAAILGAIGVTRQRNPLVARLTWFPGRIGPLPSAPVRYGFIAVALVVAAMGGAMLAGASKPGPSTVFEGTWTSTDPGDGSVQLLVVGSGGTPAVYFEDGYASGPACENDPVKRFTARGTGTVTGDRLEVVWPDGGGCGLMTVEMFPGPYSYDSATDVLVDGQDLTWARAGEAPPTDAPATDALESARPTAPPASETFTSALYGIAIDYPAGWAVNPATRLWSRDEEFFEAAGRDGADGLFDPSYDTRLLLFFASQPYGDLTPDEWSSTTFDQICPDGDAQTGSSTIDGYDSTLFSCPYGSVEIPNGALVKTEQRGYLIVFVDRGGGPRTDSYDDDWFRAMLESVDLRPENAVDPGPAAS